MVALRFILALLFCSCPALAENYFVNSSTGNDANSGLTSILAWKTLTNAFAKVGTGDTVYSTGSWTHYVKATCSTANVTFDGQGTSTITLVPASTTGTIDISGDSATFKGFTILSTATPTASVQTLLRFTGDNTRILDCTVRDIPAQSVDDEIVFEISASHCIVSNVSFLNIKDRDLFRMWHSFNKFTSCTFSNITNPNAGIGGDPHADMFQTWWYNDIQSWSNIIERCYFVDSDAACFMLKGSPDNVTCHPGQEGYWTIRNCIFNNCLSYPWMGTENTRFYNNLLYKCGAEFMHAENCQEFGWYYNNVLVDTGFRYLEDVRQGLGDNPTEDYNTFTDGTLSWGGANDDTVTEADCKFVNAAGGNFRPQQGSVLIGSGLNLTTDASMTSVDWDGNIRKSTGMWTRGPFEGKTYPYSYPNTYCVRAGATGEGTGTNWTDAFPELPATLVRGGTYYIADGVYPAYTFNTRANGTNMIYIKKATTTDYGVQTGWNAAYGTNIAEFGNLRFVTDFDSGYVEFNGYSSEVNGNGQGTNCGFRLTGNGAHDQALYFDTGTWNDVSLRYIYMGGPMTNGIGEIYDTRPWNYGLLIWSYVEVSGLVISHCVIDGFSTSIQDNPTTDGSVFEYNIFRNNLTISPPGDQYDHANVYLVNGNNATFRFNICSNYNAEGIYFVNNTTGHKIYGNLFVNGGESCHGVELPWARSHTGVEIYNNTLANLNHSSIYIGDTAVTTGCKIYNNLTYNIGYNGAQGLWILNGGAGITLRSNLVSSTGAEFVSSSSDWHLAAAVTGYNMTNDLAAGDLARYDREGNMRGADAIWDIGAYEYTGEYVDTIPPTITGATISSSGTNISITFSETVHTNAGGAGGWALGMTAGPVTFTYLSGNNSSSWVYDLSRKVSGYETVTNGLGYTTPGAGTGISDAATNFLVNTSSVPVINSSQDAKAETPVADLADGYYYGTQTITLTCDTPSPTIYYTTDGSTPDAGDTEYTVPIELSSVTILKAIATAAGYTNSNVSSNFYQINAWMSDPNNFISVALPTNSGAFSFSFDVYPTNVPLDLVIGFSKYPVEYYTNMSCIVRFNNDGFLDAYNNNDYYSELTDLRYQLGAHYRFIGTIDADTFVYSVSVSTNGTTLLPFAVNYVFREESATSDELGYLGIVGTIYPTIVSNLVWGTSVPVGPILNVEVLNVGP